MIGRRFCTKTIGSLSSRGLGLSLVDLSMSHVSTDHCRSQVDLVRCLESSGVLETTSRTRKAMERVDRAMFVPDDVGYAEPYINKPQSLGYEATMAEPEFHAYCCQKLEESLIPGANVLDIGTGTGYTATLFSLMVSDEIETGSVIAIDRVDALIDSARDCYRSWRKSSDIAHNLTEVQFKVAFESDKWTDSPDTLFDAIHVGFGLPKAKLYRDLLPRLKPNGRLVAPVIIDIDDDNDSGSNSGEQWLTLFHGNQETKLRKLLCQSMVNEPFQPELSTRQGRKDRLEFLQNELKSWRKQFESTYSRIPNSKDMMSDHKAKQLFEEFRALRSKEWSS